MSLTRRNFIASGIAATAAFQTSIQSAAASVKSNGGEIALILYTIRDLLTTPEDIKRTMNKVREIGYKNVEITSVGAMPVEDFAKLLDELDMKAVSAHRGFEDTKNNFNKVVDEFKAMKCSYVVAPVPPNDAKSKEGYEKFAKEASEVAHKLKEEGLSWGYHNHSFEFIQFDGKTGQQIMLENSDPDVFNFEIDTYWVQHGGASPSAWIKKVAGRVPTVHMKDMIVHDGGHMFAPVGEGNMDWPSILEANNEAGVKYYIVEQDRHLGDPIENITKSYNNMKSWGL